MDSPRTPAEISACMHNVTMGYNVILTPKKGIPPPFHFPLGDTPQYCVSSWMGMIILRFGYFLPPLLKHGRCCSRYIKDLKVDEFAHKEIAVCHQLVISSLQMADKSFVKVHVISDDERLFCSRKIHFLMLESI